MLQTARPEILLLWLLILLPFCIPLSVRWSDAKGNDVALGFG